jgi:hypothetical protein
VSIVSIPANSLATVTALKAKPSESKPYNAFQEGDKWRVYKVDENGKPAGDALGEHDTEDEARAQVRALYASEKPEKAAGTETPGEKANTFADQMAQTMRENGLNERRWQMDCALSDSIRSIMGDETLDDMQRGDLLRTSLNQFTEALISWIGEARIVGLFEKDTNKSVKAGRVLAARNASRIQAAMRLLHESMADAGLMEPATDDDEDETMSKAAPGGSRAADKAKHLAGPGPAGTPPTNEWTEVLREIQNLEVQLLEVDNVR